MRSRLMFLISFLILSVSISFSANEVISIHSPNFFMLGRGNEVFYPQTINADFLLTSEMSSEQVDQLLAQWSAVGVNSLRVCVDSLHAPNDPLKQYLQTNGSLKPELLSRLDRLFDAADRHQLLIALVLFDIQRMAQHWDESPYNRVNGGTLEKITDWLTHPSPLSQSLERVRQLVERYKNRNLLCWEIGRGANVWELDKRPNFKLAEGCSFWVVRIANQIRKEDEKHHLIALSYIPNTFPETLLGLPQIDLHFLQIESKDPLVSAESIVPYVGSIHRQFKKPVFVAEVDWQGESIHRESFVYNLFWASFASGSGVFLTPFEDRGRYRVADSELYLFEILQKVLPEVDLGGVPREVMASAQISPQDTFLGVESIFGFDRIFWILREHPAKGKAIVTLNTIEGQYRMQWIEPQTDHLYPPTTFMQIRKNLILESPEFERDIVGVLRLLKRAPQKQKPPVEKPAGRTN